MPEVEELIKFLKESNLDVDGFFQKIKELLGYGRFYYFLSVKSGRISGGLPGFIKDVKDLLPIDEIEKLVDEKLQSSGDFKQLVDRIKSEEFQGLIDKLAVNPKLKDLLARAEAKGVDVQAILDFFTMVFGHKFPSRPSFRSTMDLKNDFEDFSKLIPVDKIENLLLEYIFEDEDFGDVLDYIISDEFNSLTADIGNIPEVKEIIDLLQSSGLDVVSFIQRIKDFLGFNSISLHLYSRTTRITGGLSGFLKDVEALLPIAELEKLYYEKLETSEDFKKIINQLKSQKFQSLVDQVMNNPKFQELIKRAEAKGVDVETILDFLSHIFGLKFPIRVVVFSPRSLIDDLNEFVKLLPIDKIEELFFEYLSEDEDFGEALDYVTSDDFHSLINEILSMSEAKDLIEFLKISGLDVDGFFNKVKDVLGWDSRLFLLSPLRSSRISGGLPGFIKDVEALLPIDEIEEYYYKKLESSQDFANLINRLKSEKFKVLVDRVIANPKFQDLMTKAQARGVDVQAIIDFFSTLFGHQFSLTPVLLEVVEKEEEVIDILREIWSIVPTDTLLDLALDYVIEDKDCQELVQYVFSEDFHKILVEVENIPEIRSLLEFLNGAGLNIYEWLDEFHDAIGIKLNLFLSSKITGGLPGLIEDIRAALPLEDLVDIYSKKLEESKKFQEFVNRLNTHKLQNAVNALEKNDGFETWLTKLEAKGVDLNAVVEIITAITGIKFPPRPLQIIRSYGLY